MMKTWRTVFGSLLVGAACVLADGDVPQFTDYSNINQGPPDVSYRNREFRAYLSNDELRKRLKISQYSSFENPTGIFFSNGETASLNVKGGEGKKISLIVHDFGMSGSHDVYPLNEGENVIQIKSSGLGYIDYRSDHPEKEPPVHISIAGGKINGVFTPQDDEATWKRLLASAKCGILDLLGTRCQLTYDVASLRKYCPSKGPELLDLYDRIVEMEQDDVMGWKFDGSHPGNHIHGRVQWKGFMHADGYGGAFHVSTMDVLADPEALKKSSWGVAHEFGHVNQTRPGMLWRGMTEVTNNLCSSWVNYLLDPQQSRLEHEWSGTLDASPMRGGNFDNYVNSAVVRHQIWQFQVGKDPDPADVQALKREETGNVFIALAPFWQLLLYNHLALGNEDFYPRIYHDVRVTDESKMTNGELRVLFMKRACDAAQLNFSKFFVTTGMASAIDREVGDYGVAFVTVTEDMVQKMLDDVAKYPEPESDVIYYITVNSVDIFRDKLPIEVSPDAPKIELPVKQVDIPPDAWKNAVAFEAYSGEKLIRVSLRGLNHEDNETTTVICPPETDSLKAVQWDGKRITIAKLSDDPLARKKWRENIKMADVGRAIKKGDVDSLKSLLKNVNVNEKRLDNGSSMLGEAVERQKPAVVRLLLQLGAKANTKGGRDGRMPLHQACRYDNEEIVKMLLKAGADPMAQSENSAYPIHEAIWCEKNNLLPILLPYYKKINFSPDGGGNGYPAAMAIKRGNVEALKIMLKAGLKVNDERFASDPLLTIAAKEGKETMVRMLLKARAKKSAVNAEGKRAIDYAKGNIRALLR